MIEPPALTKRLLRRALRRDPAGPAIVGDFEEDFHRIARRRGPRAARLWYRWEVLALTAGRLLHALLRRLLPGPSGRGGTGSGGPLRPVAEDFRYALRSLRRSPSFTLLTATLLGVGVGAVTLVYGVASPLLLAPPFEEPHELVWIANDGERGDSSLTAVTSRTVNLVDFRERSRSFQGLTGFDAFFGGRSYTLTGEGTPERLTGVGVAHDFLEVLGVRPHLGRTFTPAEGRRGGPAAIILAHDFWRFRFGADPSVLGRGMTINGVPRTVVGVLPSGFDFSSAFSPGVDVDFLLPFVVARDRAYQGNVLSIVGRLRPGVTPEAAQTELDALVESLRREDPRRWGLGAEVTPLILHLAGPVLPALLLLGSAAAALLLMVCVNVVGLILGRAPSREREMAVRKALGASRTRLVRQLVLETLTTALGGALLGTLLAWVGTRVLRDSVDLHIPLIDFAGVSGSALAVAAGTAIAAGLLVGAIPALRIAEGGEASVLRDASRGSSAGRGARRWQDVLVISELALACGLLVVGGLLFSSFRAVLDVDLGFEPAHTLAWPLLHPGRDFESSRERSDFYLRLVEEVEARPGIEKAGLIDALPLGRNRAWGYRVPGRPETEEDENLVFPHVVDPGYLPTMGIRTVAGRPLTRDDHADVPPVVLLNETGAREIFGGVEEALGGRLRFWGRWEWEVVGVVRDVRHLSPETGPGIEVYHSLAQMPDYAPMSLVVRSRLPPDRIVGTVTAALAEVDPAMPGRDFLSLETRVRGALSERRTALGFLSAFGSLALLIAGIGIYGVLARAVAERKPEIGIRMALGASATAVVSSVVRRMLLLSAAGVGAGSLLALLALPWLDPLLFGTDPVGPAAFLAPAAALMAVAALAAAIPSWRAVETDPSSVLNVAG